MLGTQEIDAADVLEVTDLANAIARAEEVIRARSSRVLTTGPESSANQDAQGEDIFDKLVAARATTSAENAPADLSSATDDAVGPAVHVPYRPTPLPPRTSNIPLPPGIQRSATLLRAPEDVLPTPIPAAPPVTPRRATLASLGTVLPPAPPPSAPSVNATQPLAAATIPPAARTAPILILDEDAFYHPAGRIRTLADVTLDGYRPEHTLMVRLRERRKSLSWVVGAIVAVLALFAIFAVAVGFGRASADASSTDAPTVSNVAATVATTPAKTEPAPPETAPETAPETTADVKAARAAEAAPAAATDDVPVFDVNSLKNAPPARR